MRTSKIQNGCQGAQNGQWGLERGVPQDFGRQLSLNKFFDPSTPSMRKGCDGEVVEVEEVEKNSENSGPL